MLRRWSLLLASTALIFGSAMAATTASSAQASNLAPNPGGPIHLVGASHTAGGISHQATSTNWSGYADTSGRFTSVSASWTQPAGKCSSGDQYAAFWVGIDGYSSSTVEQTGSEVDCVGSRAEYYAWYEMYPGPSENYSNTVKAGDHFNSTVTYEGGESFSLFIQDTTQGWSHTTNASLGSTPSLSSAEVIVEAPCCTGSGGILPLTDFGTVSITGSTANGEAIGTSSLSPTEITMVDNSNRDKDTCSGLTSGENFTCTWDRSN
jgi:hypothetical protein